MHERLLLQFVEELERAFEACEHPHTEGGTFGWCNICGAKQLGRGVWGKPHWRDILVPAIRKLWSATL